VQKDFFNSIGHNQPLPHRSTDDRFTPISRPFLKLIVSSEKCHNRPRADAAKRSREQVPKLVNDLISPGEQRWGHVETERLARQ